MKKFLVFGYFDKNKFDPSTEPSQEERQAIFAKWGTWAEEYKENVVDMGSPIMNGMKISKDKLSDEGVSKISGYMIIRANDVNHAQEVLGKSPLFDGGHAMSYEIFESMMWSMERLLRSR